MKKFANKGILQKTIIVILTVLLINFTVPTYSNAGTGNDIGGIILSPLVDLIASLGDVVVNILQRCMTGEWGTGLESASFNMFLENEGQFWNNPKYDYMKSMERGEVINTEEFDKGWLNSSQQYHIPIATYSPEQIFTNRVSGLDINFINPDSSKFGTTIDKNGNTIVDSSAGRLQQTIAQWYVALRNLAVVGLLSVLVYVGIRIIMSSTAADKAKYKQMFTDWLIALCLLFFLHYIMSFVITLTESICTAIGGDGTSTILITPSDREGEVRQSFSTNLLGYARFKTQYKPATMKVTYLIFYIALVAYTLMFTWTYLKRLLMMAFLTLIAPLVALTYPIDKISDGQAQAFNAWIKEYTFNALLQPFHLIIYTVFVGTAMDLVQSNMLYALAALAFILPAEKILRNFFGFNKASAGTLGALTGFAAGNIANKFLKGKGGSGKGSAGKGGAEGDKPPRFERKPGVEGLDGNELMDGKSPKMGDNEQIDGNDKNIPRIDGDEQGTPKLEENNNNQNTFKIENNQDLGDSNKTKTEQNEGKEKGKFRQGMSNLANYHNINSNGAKKALKGAAKFGTKTAFKAAGATVGGAIGLASGKGLAGVAAGISGGLAIGGNMGDKALKAPGAVQKFADTARKEADIFNGNTNFQDRANAKAIKSDENNVQYLKEKMAEENGGRVPTTAEVKERMDKLDPYIAEGLTEIKDMLKAQKAEAYGVSDKQAAKIAALAKERGITADTLSDDKKYTAQLKNLTQEFRDKKGVSEDVANKMADRTLNIMKAQNGVAHDLKKIDKK